MEAQQHDVINERGAGSRDVTPELYEQMLKSARGGIVGDPYMAGKELVDLRLEVARLRGAAPAPPPLTPEAKAERKRWILIEVSARWLDEELRSLFGNNVPGPIAEAWESLRRDLAVPPGASAPTPEPKGGAARHVYDLGTTCWCGEVNLSSRRGVGSEPRTRDSV